MASYQANYEYTPLPSSPSVDTPLYTPQVFASSLSAVLLVLVFMSIPIGYLVYYDYMSFLSLGPGGTPSNFYGYCKITMLRAFALRDPCCPDPIPAELQNTGYLNPSGISKRVSERPSVAGIAPHRQLNQMPQKEIIEALYSSIAKLAREHPQDLRIATSTFEKHCPGLFSNHQVNCTKYGEVCHAHRSDGSLHMTLHPEDIKTVIEAKWGERHPLARGGWCSRFVPRGFVMVYAPRTEEEIKIVLEIIKAGICWVRGERYFD